MKSFSLQIYSLFILCLFLVSACGDADVVIREENVYLEPQEDNGKDALVEEILIEDEDVALEKKEEFSLIEDQKQIVTLNNTNISITLLGTTNRSAGFLIDGQRISVGEDSPLNRDAYQMTLLETTTKTIPVPRKSRMDVSVSRGLGVSSRLILPVGKVYELVLGEETVSVSLGFVGRSEGIEKGQLHVGPHTVYVGVKEEEYWDDGLSLYVHEIFFSDGNQYELVDGATISFIER